MEAALQMELEIYAQTDLNCEKKVEYWSVFPMYVRSELASFVCVAKEIAHDDKGSCCDLHWHMPSTLYHLRPFVSLLDHSKMSDIHPKPCQLALRTPMRMFVLEYVSRVSSPRLPVSMRLERNREADS